MEYFFYKGEILVKVWFKGLNYHNFTFFILTNFKTDRYLNNFQEHLFGILKLRKCQTSLQNFSHVRTRLLNMTLSNLRFNVSRSFVTMETNLPSCFYIEFLEQLLKFIVNFTLLKYVKSQRGYGFLITKELIFGFQILDLEDHFSASLKDILCNSDIAKRMETGESKTRDRPCNQKNCLLCTSGLVNVILSLTNKRIAKLRVNCR